MWCEAADCGVADCGVAGVAAVWRAGPVLLAGLAGRLGGWGGLPVSLGLVWDASPSITGTHRADLNWTAGTRANTEN